MMLSIRHESSDWRASTGAFHRRWQS